MDTTPIPIPPSQPTSTIAPTIPLEYASEPAGQYALYSPQAVGLATFLGAPIAGTAIMALNYRRLGRSASAVKAVACGVLVTAVLIGLGFALPSHAPGLPIAIVSIVMMAQTAKMLQGEVFNRHKLAGGKVASMWKAAGVGLVSFVVLVVVIIAGVFATSPSKGTRLAVGSGEIFYSGAATQADAQALGKALTDDGYFGGGRASSVLLSKNAAGFTVGFVVNDEFAQKPNAVDLFTKVIEEIAPSIGGKPITLRLLNSELTELKLKKVE